ncbi:MAG: hypothetical protein AAFN93_08455 [Bacteroidota bacterium]
MIRLTRSRSSSAIKAKYRGGEKKQVDAKLLFAWRDYLKDSEKKVKFKSSFWKTAKDQLKKETYGKCAYCESNTQVVAYGDVEHYRPKSIYWWLAYTYDNYLYSCQICNQRYKSNHFPVGAHPYPEPVIEANTSDAQIKQLAGNISPDPLDVEDNYTLQRYLNEHKTEKAYLLNPYLDDPTIYFAYEADDNLEEVSVVPTSENFREFIEAAENYYGINRIELKNFRYRVFKNFRVLKKTYQLLDQTGGDNDLKLEIEEQISEMLSGKYLFAGMNRYFDSRL